MVDRVGKKSYFNENFRVEGGADKSTYDFYNPLYISDDQFGGYAKLSNEEKEVTNSIQQSTTNWVLTISPKLKFYFPTFPAQDNGSLLSYQQLSESLKNFGRLKMAGPTLHVLPFLNFGLISAEEPI